MRRRKFITLIGGAAAAWPLAASAQQPERMRRIGIVTSVLETDADAQARYAVLRQALQQLGWTEGRNIQFDHRFGSAGDSDVVRKHAQELVALAPDLVAALQQVSRTVPIAFLGIVDPVGAGFVASLARPGGNTTGFTPFEYGMGGKWLGATQTDRSGYDASCVRLTCATRAKSSARSRRLRFGPTVD
jgi:putative ABC transport system substrate-binding protein